MPNPRDIFIGSKPLHSYINAVRTTMSEGERVIRLVARGRNISMAVDVAEVCRRRAGIIAGKLPEDIDVSDVELATETFPRDDGGTRNVSVIKITMEGHGDMHEEE
jgi:DNA-binding protein